MLILTHQINREGGIQIKTKSGDVIWISFIDLQSPTKFKVALEAPASCQILRANLVEKSEIEECSPAMQRLLSPPKRIKNRKK